MLLAATRRSRRFTCSAVLFLLWHLAHLAPPMPVEQSDWPNLRAPIERESAARLSLSLSLSLPLCSAPVEAALCVHCCAARFFASRFSLLRSSLTSRLSLLQSAAAKRAHRTTPSKPTNLAAALDATCGSQQPELRAQSEPINSSRHSSSFQDPTKTLSSLIYL